LGKSPEGPWEFLTYLEYTQSAAELWLVKVCPERSNCAFSEKFGLGQKLGFSPIILATDALASQSKAL